MPSDLFKLASEAAGRIGKTFADLFRMVGPFASHDEIRSLKKMAEDIERPSIPGRPAIVTPPPGPQPGRERKAKLSDRIFPNEPPAESDIADRRFSPIYQRPASSNVYSFQYDYVDKTLYVAYKAPIINSDPGAVRNVKGVVFGTRGKTVISNRHVPRPHLPGFLYAYYGVPPIVFSYLLSAGSAGKGVWDVLRVRGTIHGTQYPYELVSGSVGPASRGEVAVYVPRKATERGFVGRKVPVMEVRGKKPTIYMESGLPDEEF